MVQQICRVRSERQVVPARRCLIQTPGSSTATAQTTGTNSAPTATTSSPAAASSSTCPCSTAVLDLGPDPNHFTDAHVQRGIGRPGTDAVGNDLFVGTEGQSVEATKLRLVN